MSNTVTHKIANDAEFMAAHKAFVEKEKALMKAQTALAAERRALPWRAVNTDYVFSSPSEGKVKLSEMMKNGNDLIVYHLMYPDSWDNACAMCCSWLDGFNGSLGEIQARTNIVSIGAASTDRLAKLSKAKNWQLALYSSAGTTFGKDFGVQFSPEELKTSTGYNYGRKPFCPEMPGISVFHLGADGVIYHTYSTFGPGLSNFKLSFALLDITPEGRNEAEKGSQHWVRHKEEYKKV